MPAPLPAASPGLSASNLPRIDDRHTGGFERPCLPGCYREAAGLRDRRDVAVGRADTLPRRSSPDLHERTSLGRLQVEGQDSRSRCSSTPPASRPICANTDPSLIRPSGLAAASRMSRISASVLRPCWAARTRSARWVAAGMLRIVIDAVDFSLGTRTIPLNQKGGSLDAETVPSRYPSPASMPELSAPSGNG